MKVRQSQIPEDSGKPKRLKSSKINKPVIPVVDSEEDLEESEEVWDRYDTGVDTAKEGEEDKQYVKTMINLPEIGLISLFAIQTVEKDFRIVESAYGSGFIKTQFGITINKNIEPSPHNRVDVSVWYDKEETRDQRYDRLMKILEDVGFKIINV